MRLRLAVCLAIVALTGFASAGRDPFAGIERYPQFRNMSGLPGGMFAVSPEGTFSFHGALAMSTPIAYSLASKQFVVSGGGMADNGRWHFATQNKDGTTNSSAALMAGLTTPLGNLTYSYMILSVGLDHVHNFQFTPKLNLGKTKIAFGAQDLQSHGGASGDIYDIPMHLSSRTWYVVATTDFGHDVYASLGKGDRRLKGIFGNVSAPITPKIRGMLEYDTFNWNIGAAYDLGKINKHTSVQGYIGYTAFRYSTLGLTFGFNF